MTQTIRGPLAAMGALVAAALSGCLLDVAEPPDDGVAAASVTITEGFEAGSKTAYAAANVSLGTGTWNLSDALIGTSSSDAGNGSRSARVRNSGRVTMQFDHATGVGTVSVKHAIYGSDSAGSFALYWSDDGGSSWTKAGSTVATSSTTLATATFTVNRSGAVRIELRKMDGGSNRINLDDIAISDYGSAPDPDPDPDPDPGQTPGSDVSVHTALGLPSAAGSSWSDFLSVKSQYVISYNSDRKGPNWVSWELNASYLGSAPRQDDYRSDNTLPSSMPQAKPSDYSGSGWDRGHMTPSGDRTKTTAANSQTFYLSNMLPQSSNSNGGPWAKLETYARTLATQGRELYIVAGGVHTGSVQTIGSGVEVPDELFKVIVVLDHPGLGVSAVTSSTRVIGVLIPNDDGEVSASDDWKSFRVAPRDIEQLTGLDFLADVPQSVQDVVENHVDNL
jgi:endonuclease G